MNFLHMLLQAATHPNAPQGMQHGGGPMSQAGPHQQGIPVGQPIPQGAMNHFDPQTRQLAQIYQNNPMDPRVMHIDPKVFGYAPDNTAQQFNPQMQGSMGQQHGMASNFSTPIQGMQNPGYIPMQGSRGVMPMQGGSPQIQIANHNPQPNIRLY